MRVLILKIKLPFVFVILFLTTACSSAPQKFPPQNQIPQRIETPPAPIPQEKEVLKAPWELWSDNDFGSIEISKAEAAIEYGDLLAAIQAYEDAERSLVDPILREEAFLRKMGTLLKLGRGKIVLGGVSEHLRSQGKSNEEIDGRLAFVVAFAYRQMKDKPQAFAWFTLAKRRAEEAGNVKILSQIQAETKALVQEISRENFEETSSRFAADSFVAPLFSEERLRRARGGRPVVVSGPNWFSPNTYAKIHAQQERGGILLESDIAKDQKVVPEGAKVSIGVLLPFSGRFSSPASEIKQGLELALEKFDRGNAVHLVFADSEGESEQALRKYKELVSQGGVSLVLGPLLVKTTETVSKQSELEGVPLLSFTKTPGIPELGTSVFRLGATTSGETAELVAYATYVLGLQSFATFYPLSSSGKEYAQSFREHVEQVEGQMLMEYTYSQGNEQSVLEAIVRLERNPPDAIFLPDKLENVWPLVELIKKSSLKERVLLGSGKWDDLVALRGFGQLLDGAIFVSPFYVLSEKDDVVEFVRSYRDKFGRNPGFLSAQAFDAMRYVLLSVDLENNTPQRFTERLRNADNFIGITGKLQVNIHGDITRRMSVLQLNRGDIYEVMFGGIPTGFVPNEPNRES